MSLLSLACFGKLPVTALAITQFFISWSKKAGVIIASDIFSIQVVNCSMRVSKDFKEKC